MTDYETSYKFAFDRTTCADSPDPAIHIWDNNTLPPPKGARCMCGKFKWPPERPVNQRKECETMSAKFIVSTMIDDTKVWVTQSAGSKTEIFLSCRKSEAKVFTDDALPWLEKGYDVEVLPEDQVMRLVGAPQLPGMEG